MKLSLKVEYACRVLVQLARHHASGKLLHIEDLASAESVPQNYLVQILNELRNGGLVSSRRGKQGGYLLAKDPELITLYDIIRVVDSEMIDAQVSDAGQSGPRVAAAWKKVGNLFEAEIQKVTLAGILSADGGNMYYI